MLSSDLTFEIFQIKGAGQLTWKATVLTLEATTTVAAALVNSCPRAHLTVSREMGRGYASRRAAHVYYRFF
jgi:hypothetical protein